MPESTNMTPTDDFDAWTEADDAFLRGHLSSLRDDLDPHAMPEPALVRARVNRERRGGRRTWTLAAVAAAAVVAAAVVWNPLAGRDGSDAVPGTTSPSLSASSTSATQYGFGDEPGILPLAKEWSAVLGEPVTATDVTEGPECGAPGQPALEGQSLTGSTSGIQGGQYVWNFGDAAGAAAGFDKVVAGVEDCSPVPITATRQPDPDGSNPLGWPRVYRYTAQGEAGGWFVVTRADAFVTLIQVNPASGKPLTTTLAQARMLGEAAQLRLSTGGSTGETSQPTPATSAPTGSTNADLRIRRVGGATVPASEFLSLAEWNAGRQGSAPLVSVVPEEQTGTGVNVLCDPATDAGAGAINYLRLSNDTTWVGYQRILTTNIASDGDTNAGEPAAMVAAFIEGRSCPTGSDPTVKVVRGPLDGTVKVTTTFAGGVRPTVSYVGVTTMATPNHTTTIVLEGAAQDEAAWTDLQRLMGLARAR